MSDRLGLRLADLATRINDKLGQLEVRIGRAESGGLSPLSNLADLSDTASARLHLGLGTAATLNIKVGATPPADTTALWIDTN